MSEGKKILPDKAGKKYRTERLLKSRHLAGYQPDFARVILTEPEYTIKEARAALDKAMKGGDLIWQEEHGHRRTNRFRACTLM